MKLAFYVCLCDSTAVWKQICKQILCLHSLTQFFFFFFLRFSPDVNPGRSRNKKKQQKKWAKLLCKGCAGLGKWERISSSYRFTTARVWRSEGRSAEVNVSGRKTGKGLFFFFFLFDAAVIISWVCETQRRLKCPLMACLISEWQFCQLGLDWSLCLRAICFLQVTKKRLNTPVTK